MGCVASISVMVSVANTASLDGSIIALATIYTASVGLHSDSASVCLSLNPVPRTDTAINGAEWNIFLVLYQPPGLTSTGINEVVPPAWWCGRMIDHYGT